jgi:predicted DNA-binding protein
MKTSRIQIQIDNEKLRKKLKDYSRKHGRLMKAVVKDALEKYFIEVENNA